ncbi:hypothetical protein PSTG_09391 [Puccinia striiformis f. sp. tritici PST-78]|uniref:Uncharacterized protein n=1 Tax=Puccinia striiformis f. sp. tritici PST-78 TaxID=1165861 RepID=A0A0L0VDA0_9BASI|nr:hypothetical protein PSTG_09391 [Puccinia striiformis f. sp. tritici PST-78]
MANRIYWDHDQVDAGLSSNGVLLAWLGAPGNYERWGFPPSRNDAASEILEEMQANGLHYHTSTSIQFGISRLITLYQSAGKRYRQRVGCEPPASQTMTAERGWGSPEGELLLMCRHWYTLDPIMRERDLLVDIGIILDLHKSSTRRLVAWVPEGRSTSNRRGCGCMTVGRCVTCGHPRGGPTPLGTDLTISSATRRDSPNFFDRPQTHNGDHQDLNSKLGGPMVLERITEDPGGATLHTRHPDGIQEAGPVGAMG